MKVLVTGATGFLGRSIVRELARRGHEVVALARPAAKLPEDAPKAVTYIRGDLRQKGDWRTQIRGVDVIVHAAAATGGGFPEQFASSVVATENLLECVDWKSLRRLVHVSSFSVYDYSGARGGSTIDETHSLEQRPERRDAYTWTKLVQEQLVLQACHENETSLVRIRPGAIYGPGKDWDCGAALRLGRFDLLFSPWTTLRLTHVDNCADAIAFAAEAEGAEGVYNIVDDDAPTHAQYHRLCRKAGAPPRAAIYVPWWAVASVGLGVKLINKLFFAKRARLPEILDFPRQQARWRPFSYSNVRAKTELKWAPRVRIEDATRLMFEGRTMTDTSEDPREPPRRPIKFGLLQAIMVALTGVAIAVTVAVANS